MKKRIILDSGGDQHELDLDQRGYDRVKRLLRANEPFQFGLDGVQYRILEAKDAGDEIWLIGKRLPGG